MHFSTFFVHFLYFFFFGRKRKPSEKESTKVKLGPVLITAKNRRRSQQQASDSNVEMDDDDDDFDLIGPSEPAKPIDTASQQLRAWIDQYEEAVTNHYSPELRARLASNKLAGVAGDLKPSVIGSNTRCNVSLQGNGVKVRVRKPNLLTLTRSRIFRSSIKRNLLTFVFFCYRF